MAQSQSGFDLREYQNECDRTATDVMPEHWDGHGRVLIHESDLSDKAQQYADKLFEKLSERYPSTSAEWLAKKVIKRAEQKF